jgi:branched-chain amino acid aminotransferase
MAFDTTKLIWMNGKFLPWQEATFHVSAHALHYGSGVFEGMRCYETVNGPAIFRLDEHLARLYASAAVYGIEIPVSLEELAQATRELITLNGFSGCYIRHIAFYGSESLALHPGKCPVQVAILAWPWGHYLGAEAAKSGVRITVSPWLKFHSQMMPTRAKACGQYLNSILAVRDAVARGYDEALLLDSHGHIAEGSGENLFLVSDGRILTNNEDDSILLGITRDSVIQIARDLGYSVETHTLHLEDLLTADEAFFTGTAVEVVPVREVDGKPIGSGVVGRITTKIQSAFVDAVAGCDLRYEHWLTPVAQKLEVVI